MKNNKQTYGIKKKLTAAVAMLLVATIMLVSTTYAWFTLSTAPEVKGISTTVGANGNLEMALSGPKGEAPGESGTTDSMAARTVKEANLTWGNLVDLSDASYGLGNIKLMPAKLANTGLNDKPLVVPVYGYDGRIASVDKTTITGHYEDSSFVVNGTTPSQDDYGRGVRVIGTSSSMTAEQAAFQGFQQAATEAIYKAKTAASKALADDGAVLMAALLAHAAFGSSEDTATYDDYIEGTNNLTAGLKAAVVELQKAVANIALAEATKDSAVYNALTTKDVAGMTAYLVANINNFSDEFKAIAALVAALDTKVNGISELSGTNISWGAYEGAASKLLNITKITIDGKDAVALGTLDQSQKMALGGKIVGNSAVIIEPAPAEGSSNGAYSDLAAIIGAYSATADLYHNGLAYSVGDFEMSLVEGNVATIRVDTNETKTAVTLTAGLTAPAKPDGASTSDYIDDTYGYVLDFWFRTNAAGSKLLLQAEGTQRVYDGNDTNLATAGAGSVMIYTGEPTDNLLNNVKLVFINAVDGTVLAKGALDADTKKDVDGGTSVEVYLIDENTKEKRTGADKDVICALNQNEAKAISVLVYLDGEGVTNADVSAIKNTSLEGTLNLQFASSATLMPMENSDMRNATKPTTPPPVVP